jgi:hypothetical protein
VSPLAARILAGINASAGRHHPTFNETGDRPVYGSPEGDQTNRAQIARHDAANKVVAYERFNDPGMTFEADSNVGGVILMHLPSTVFQSVLDILHNEKPIQVSFAQGRGFFGTSTEAVGEGEG